jgi:hypothetical protein
MYLTTFGGSGLLHLLAAYPRVVGVLGIAATVTLLMSPSGTGRQIGTAEALARIDRSIAARGTITPAEQARSEAAVSAILERGQNVEIKRAVDGVLQRCGAGCTDLTSDTIAADPVLLRRVLLLEQLDRSHDTRRETRSAQVATNATR